jgi:hypothetical protein
MKIAKFQPDEEGVIRIASCIAAVWIGVQNDIPTIMCFVAEEGEVGGKNLTFYVKMVGDNITPTEMHQFACAMVTKDVEYFLFGERPSIITQAGPAGPSTVPPGMAGRGFLGQ